MSGNAGWGGIPWWYTFTLATYRSVCATYYFTLECFGGGLVNFCRKIAIPFKKHTHTLAVNRNAWVTSFFRVFFFVYQHESSPCVPRQSGMERGPYLYWPYGFFTSFPYLIISPALAQDDSYFVHTDEYKLIPYLQQRLIYSPFISLNCINVCQFSYLFLFCLTFCSYVFLLFLHFCNIFIVTIIVFCVIFTRILTDILTRSYGIERKRVRNA